MGLFAFSRFPKPDKAHFFQLIVIRLKSQKKLSRIGCFSYNKTSATNQYTIYILTRPIEMIEDTINLHTYWQEISDPIIDNKSGDQDTLNLQTKKLTKSFKL